MGGICQGRKIPSSHKYRETVIVAEGTFATNTDTILRGYHNVMYHERIYSNGVQFNNSLWTHIFA